MIAIRTLLLLLIFSTLNAQQWLDKKYSYDSLLNIVYGTAIDFNGTEDTLKMDLYLPRCDDPAQLSKKPLMVWIHGGAFLAGDRKDASITRMCKQFARRGYVTASIEYRLGFVSDDAAWTCNFPNYSCVFASDSAEWIRAWYRGVQDAKGAVRYLVNRHAQYRIDPDNIFVAGESAGSLIALGVGLLDTIVERMPQTYAIAPAPKPHNSTAICAHNAGRSFTAADIPRPDLGGIDGTIESSATNYTIKGIANIYGAMFSDLLRHSKAGNTKPAIYSFHQPCDIVVPIDSGKVYAGLSWCMTNGYNCMAIANTAKLYGSRGFSAWNNTNGYGYAIHNEFTTTSFPYNFLFGPGSCADQVNNPCHAYDNTTLRENNLAAYFAPLISTSPLCEPGYTLTGLTTATGQNEILVYPNPVESTLTLQIQRSGAILLQISNTLGEVVKTVLLTGESTKISAEELPAGIYNISVRFDSGAVKITRFSKL